MPVLKPQIWWMLLAGVLLVGVVITGFVLVDLPRVDQVCSGEVVSTDLCEPARLGRSIFGSVLTGAGVIALAIIVAAALRATRGADRVQR